MIGAIAGDIIGSVHETTATKTKHFLLFTAESDFTDDTVLTIAVAEVLLNGTDYRKVFQDYYWRYPDAGYGQQFRSWCQLGKAKPYNSWGNGSAMRVSPVAYGFETLEETLSEAQRSASSTHNHPLGIKGAQATAAAIFLARQKRPKQEIADYIQEEFGYKLDRSLKSVRRTFLFDISCEGTVPWAIRSFLEAEDYEDAVRNAISLGGDADTLACIAGGIAGAFYGVPENIRAEALSRLDAQLRSKVEQFEKKFGKLD